MANGGSSLLITSTGTNAATVLYNPSINNGVGTNSADLPCTTFFVSSQATNTLSVLVNVQPLHGTNQIGLSPGTTLPFRAGSNGIQSVSVQASGSSGAAIDYGILVHL